MDHIVTNAPTTSQDIKRRFNGDGEEEGLSVNSAVHGLKQKNLIKAVGHVSGLQVLVPTHLAYKELYTVHGMSLKERCYEEEGEDGDVPTIDAETDEDEEWAF